MTNIPFISRQIPSLSTRQMIEVDRLMIEVYGIDLTRMMENAGRGLAILVREYLQQKANTSGDIIVLAGTGGNGGGAMVAARRLINWGYSIKVVVTDPLKLTPVPARQYDILKKMGAAILPVASLDDIDTPNLILDGIIGYSLNGNPRGSAQSMIEWANAQNAPVISLDTPSGVELTEGKVFHPAIKAIATLTLALPKHGLFHDQVLPYRGDLYLTDISVPPVLYRTLGIMEQIADIFHGSDIVRIP